VSLFFFDSSALVKRYIANEIGSGWVQHITNPRQPNKIYIAAITGVEVISAIMRNVRTGGLSQRSARRILIDFQNDFENQYELLRITDGVVLRAMELPKKRKLRAYDAVQLAAALILNDLSSQQGIPATGVPPLVLVASDQDLLAAAQAEGLQVDDPRQYP
jgi:predicted nucleic acid-binding protein